MSEERLILAADPGYTSGFSAFKKQRDGSSFVLAKYGLIRPMSSRVVFDMLYGFSSEFAAINLFVEEQYIPTDKSKFKKLSGNSLIKLTMNSARWVVVGELFKEKVSIKKVYPQTWQSAVAGVGFGVDRKNRKKRVLSRVESIFKGSKITQDEADSIGIGLWGLRFLGIRFSQDQYPMKGVRL